MREAAVDMLRFRSDSHRIAVMREYSAEARRLSSRVMKIIAESRRAMEQADEMMNSARPRLDDPAETAQTRAQPNDATVESVRFGDAKQIHRLRCSLHRHDGIQVLH